MTGQARSRVGKTIWEKRGNGIKIGKEESKEERNNFPSSFKGHSPIQFNRKHFLIVCNVREPACKIDNNNNNNSSLITS
jgi:hypothetical protein